MSKGRKRFEVSLPCILEVAENKLSLQLQIEMQYLYRQIANCDQRIVLSASELEACWRLLANPRHWTGDRHGMGGGSSQAALSAQFVLQL